MKQEKKTAADALLEEAPNIPEKTYEEFKRAMIMLNKLGIKLESKYTLSRPFSGYGESPQLDVRQRSAQLGLSTK